MLDNAFNSNIATNTATSADLAKVFYAAVTDSKPKRRYFNSVGDRMVVHIARAHPKCFEPDFQPL